MAENGKTNKGQRILYKVKESNKRKIERENSGLASILKGGLSIVEKWEIRMCGFNWVYCSGNCENCVNVTMLTYSSTNTLITDSRLNIMGERL